MSFIHNTRGESHKSDAPQSKSQKDAKPRATHTARELQDIRETFGPGSDVALRSIQKDTGFKITVVKRD